MTATKKRRPFYWEDFVSPKDDTKPSERHELPPGHQLTALRRGAGREPGTVPAMWPFYTQLKEDGRLTKGLIAEHYALVLFGFHQQSERILVHQPDIPVGKAIAMLRDESKQNSPEAIEERFTRAATAADVKEVAYHLRGLIQLLKTLQPTQGFDYTQLYWDLRGWQDPQSQQKVRREWGAAFYQYGIPTKKTNETTEKE